ncbi:beta-propeller fold lactonase family protein [Luteococcus sp. H138]|uniref:lactonase family protein n=1 Tax=unclassified Luteococcus TaxID=2639923 RepID=UPI00313D395D
MSENAQPHVHLLIGCYTDESGTDGILPTHLTPSGPTVSGPGVELPNASWLVHHDGLVLAVSEWVPGRLAVLRHDGEQWRVASSAPTQGADPCHLAVSPDGAWIAVANYGSGSVSLFVTPGSASLDEPLAVLAFEGNGPVAGRQDSSHAHQVTWLDDDHLLVCDLGADQLRVVRVRATGGGAELEELTAVNLPPGTGPRHLVLRQTAPSEQQVAVAGELNGQVIGLRHEGTDWANGWWVGHNVLATHTPGASQPSGLRWFGHDLVLANRGTDTIALVRWGDDGTLALVSESPCGGRSPRDLAEHGGLLFVANQESDEVSMLAHRGDGFEQVGQLQVRRPASLLFGSVDDGQTGATR